MNGWRIYQNFKTKFFSRKYLRVFGFEGTESNPSIWRFPSSKVRDKGIRTYYGTAWTTSTAARKIKLYREPDFVAAEWLKALNNWTISLQVNARSCCVRRHHLLVRRQRRVRVPQLRREVLVSRRRQKSRPLTTRPWQLVPWQLFPFGYTPQGVRGACPTVRA